MKYVVSFFVTLLTIFYINIARSESLIVYINMEMIMNETNAGKSISQKLERIHNANIAEFKKIEDKLREEETLILSQKNILSEVENLLQNKNPRLITVSRLEKRKNHEKIIMSLRNLKQLYPNIIYTCIGHGEEEENIKKLINQIELKDYVILTGFQPDPALYYKAMDVMVLPSYSGEATSQVLPQAMLMGKPVISTEIGGLSEVVIHNRTGLIIPAKNSLEIFNAIKNLYKDNKLRNKLAEQGRVHALNNFTFERMIKTTETVYHDVVGR